MGPRLTMREQIIIRISLRDDVPLRWPSCEDYSARSSLPSKQRVAGSNPAGRARSELFKDSFEVSGEPIGEPIGVECPP
jgi:hypothetical protein